MSRKRENIGLTTGNGKERSTQSMSELLEKILDNRNMNEAYKKAVTFIAPVPVSFEDIPGDSKGFFSPTEKRIGANYGY